MAKFAFELEYTPREMLGKGASRRLRRLENQVLGVIYGGEEAAMPISLNQFHVSKALENEAIYSHILTLISNGKKQKVVLKDIQRHPAKGLAMHMDFLRISRNKPITMHVPIHFVGDETAPGITEEGGTVTHHMVEVEIKCLPDNLPEFLEVDLSQAKLNDVVHLSHIKLPEGVELVTVIHDAADDAPVASIHLPKIIKEEEEDAPEAEGKAEEGEADKGDATDGSDKGEADPKKSD